MFKKDNEDLDDFKKKREDFSFNIRRNNRQDFFNKRRNIGEIQNADQQNKNQNIVDLQHTEEIKKMHDEPFYLENIQQYTQMINSNDYLIKLRGVIAMRKIIDGERQQTFNHFFASDLATKFIGFLSQNNEPQVKLEAAWLFSSLSYGSSVCHILVKLEIVKPLLQLLIENQLYIVDQALVCLGNISADHEDLRDIILNHSALQILYQLLSTYHRSTTYLNTIWTITNLCRGKNPPTHVLIDSAINILCKETKNKELQNLENPEVSRVMQDILSTFSALSEKSKSQSDRIIQGDVLPLIFNFSLSQSNSHSLSAIRIIGNLAHQGEHQTQALISNGIFDLSLKLLKSPKKSIRRQTCWILSNIAAGVVSQVNKFLDRPDVLEKLIQLMKSDVLQVKQQIAWVFPNLGHLGDKSRLLKLFQQTDIMRIYIDLLDQNNPQFLSEILKCILKILMVGNKSLVDGNNVMLVKFMEYGGTEKVDKLQFHESSVVYKSAVNIITKFFDVEEAS